MAKSTFIFKRKKYSDNNESGSSWGKKLAIGAGTVAATVGAFYGAKKGMFGASAQKWAGNAYAKTGKFFGSSNMMKSGAKDYAQGAAKQAFDGKTILEKGAKMPTSKKAAANTITNAQFNRKAGSIERNYIKELGGIPSTPAN